MLGVVQGLTEFLPISSSGHLVVAEAAIGLATPGVTVEVALHVATVLAVLAVYRGRVAALVRGMAQGAGEAWRYVFLLLIATLPAAAAGLLLGDIFERAFDSLVVVGANFIVTGTILWSTARVVETAAAPQPGRGGALGIGVAQALAILPGISRSGTTVAAALWLRVEPVRAAEFSFLLAIPAIAGAALLQVPRVPAHLSQVGWGPLAVSCVAALVAGIVAIRLLVALLRRRAFHRFAPYCWFLGLVTTVVGLSR